MGAIVTTFHIEDEEARGAYCGLPRWCLNADWAVAHVAPAAEVMIFTNTEGIPIVRRECPNARVLPFDESLVELVRQWDARSSPPRCTGPECGRALGEHKLVSARPARRSQAQVDWIARRQAKSLVGTPRRKGLRKASSHCPRFTLLKLQTVDPKVYRNASAGGADVVMYLDLDVDLRWQTSAQALQRFDFRGKLDEFRRDPSCLLRATPDHSATINTGIMLLKPNRHAYEHGVELLRTSVWDSNLGFNGTGPPKQSLYRAQLDNRSRGGPGPLIRAAKAYWTDSWDFVCGDGDQGLFTTIFMAHQQRFCVPSYWDKPLRVHHFWAGDKPWGKPASCERYFDFLPSRGGLLGIGKHQTTFDSKRSGCTDFLQTKAKQARGRSCQGRAWPLI